MPSINFPIWIIILSEVDSFASRISFVYHFYSISNMACKTLQTVIQGYRHYQHLTIPKFDDQESWLAVCHCALAMLELESYWDFSI